MGGGGGGGVRENKKHRVHSNLSSAESAHSGVIF